jgi:hypothetical protein
MAKQDGQCFHHPQIENGCPLGIVERFKEFMIILGDDGTGKEALIQPKGSVYKKSL